MRARSTHHDLVRAVLLVALGCDTTPPAMGADAAASSADAAAGAPGTIDGGRLAPPPITRSRTEAELAPERRACRFAAGAWPAETIGTDYPLGEDIPIQHVIVVMQENRSFDNYLGRLAAQGYYRKEEVDVPPAGWSNPDGQGGTVVPHFDDGYCYGVNHGWDDMHDMYDGGRLDRFVTNNNPNGQRSFYYEDDTVIPFYYALADRFAIGDRYFASVLTSTWPNRLYLMAATSFGLGDNSLVAADTEDHPAPNVMALLEAAGRTWKDYTDQSLHQVMFFPYFGFRSESFRRYGDTRCDIFRDIEAGQLPDVAFLMGDELTGSSDEGPSALPGVGGLLVEQIVRALWATEAWKDTVVFITYDENGGMADHVPPVEACPPDALPPRTGGGRPLAGAFDRTGFRVPFIVVSPYARPHFVSHEVYDHASITRFIEARFGLPALTARDANATPPMDLFDFSRPSFATPPQITAHTTVDPAILKRCRQSLAPVGCAMARRAR